MKHLLLSILFIGIVSNSHAHKYYFGFAEIEYNTFTLCFETTMTVTAHDLERALQSQNTDAGDLTTLNPEQKRIVENYINNSFSIKSNEKKCVFKLVGHESNLDGTLHLYLESSPLPIEDSIEITFNTLMEEYSEQQNKITLYCYEKIYTKAFTQRTQKQTLVIYK